MLQSKNIYLSNKLSLAAWIQRFSCAGNLNCQIISDENHAAMQHDDSIHQSPPVSSSSGGTFSRGSKNYSKDNRMSQQSDKKLAAASSAASATPKTSTASIHSAKLQIITMLLLTISLWVSWSWKGIKNEPKMYFNERQKSKVKQWSDCKCLKDTHFHLVKKLVLCGVE